MRYSSMSPNSSSAAASLGAPTRTPRSVFAFSAEIASRRCQAANDSQSPSSVPSFRLVPIAGDIVAVRQRQYLVTEVLATARDGAMTVVRLVCLDDDAQGRPLEVLWELELGAGILQPQAKGLGEISTLDEPRQFAAYFHALKWRRRASMRSIRSRRRRSATCAAASRTACS